MTLDTILTLVIAAGLVGSLGWLMERTHRRSAGRLGGFTPSSAPVDDADRRRAVADLRAVA